MKCASCENVFHPATGHVLSEKTVLCLTHAVEFARWVKSTLKRKTDGVRFYDHIETSRNKSPSSSLVERCFDKAEAEGS